MNANTIVITSAVAVPSGEANATYVDVASASPVLPTPVVVPRFEEVDIDGRHVDHPPYNTSGGPERRVVNLGRVPDRRVAGWPRVL